MNDALRMAPALPVMPPVPPQSPVRPDLRVEPAEKTRADSAAADNGNARNGDPADGQQERNLTISRQEQLGTFVYRSIDAKSGDLIWQYPPENMLRAAQQLQEMQKLMGPQVGQQADAKA